MVKVIRIYDESEKSIIDKVRFHYNLMYGKRASNGDGGKKAFIEKFYNAYYGKEQGSTKLDKFYSSTESFFGGTDDNAYVNIVLKEDCLDLRKFGEFFHKVYPSVNLEVTEVGEVGRIEYIKSSFAGIMYEELELGNMCDMDISLEDYLKPEEVEALMDLRNEFPNGYKYRMNQYPCEVCKGYDETKPIHLEFDPFAVANMSVAHKAYGLEDPKYFVELLIKTYNEEQQNKN